MPRIVNNKTILKKTFLNFEKLDDRILPPKKKRKLLGGSKLKTLKYKVSIYPSIKRNLKNFKRDVHNILSNKKSWKINFIHSDEDFDFEIILTPAKEITNICNFEGLSCADIMMNKIYINNYRWSKGAKPSKLSVKDYRIYLINHEVGHILGMDHDKPIKGRKVPVMNQHTLGIGSGKPYMWPLEREQKEMLKMQKII